MCCRPTSVLVCSCVLTLGLRAREDTQTCQHHEVESDRGCHACIFEGERLTETMAGSGARVESKLQPSQRYHKPEECKTVFSDMHVLLAKLQTRSSQRKRSS